MYFNIQSLAELFRVHWLLHAVTHSDTQSVTHCILTAISDQTHSLTLTESV